jgi:hypothetical protein
LFDLGNRKATLLDPDPQCNPKVVPFQLIGKALKGDASDLTDDKGNNNDKDNERVRSLIRNCSLIAGLYPDDVATVAIVKTSLQLGVLFATLPCCYPYKIFEKPSRHKQKWTKRCRTRDNILVDPHQCYRIGCQYLLERATAGMRFQMENLSFQGWNKSHTLSHIRARSHHNNEEESDTQHSLNSKFIPPALAFLPCILLHHFRRVE